MIFLINNILSLLENKRPKNSSIKNSAAVLHLLYVSRKYFLSAKTAFGQKRLKASNSSLFDYVQTFSCLLNFW